MGHCCQVFTTAMSNVKAKISSLPILITPSLPRQWVCMDRHTVEPNLRKGSIPRPYRGLFHEIQNFKPMNHFPKNSIQSIQMRLLGVSNEKLASICVGPTICHCKYSPCIVLEGLPYFIIELLSPYAGATLSCSRRIPTLDHKTFDISMEYSTIIITTGTQCQEILGSLGDLVAGDLALDVPEVRVQRDRHGRLSRSVSASRGGRDSPSRQSWNLRSAGFFCASSRALNLSTDSGVSSSWPILTAGGFVAVALLLSFYLIFEHLGAYNQPEEQKFLIGLILMVPVYAVESFLSLLNSEVAFVCEIMRDCYEAFAMYCFERYLIACLGGEESTIKFMESQVQISSSTPLLEVTYENGVVDHPFPLNRLLKEWRLGSHFYQAVKVGIVQYMILKTVCALLAIILELGGVYGEGKFQWRYGYPYLAVVLNFSQTWALYCLVKFYSVIKEKLEPIKPLAKFLVFKSIVFLTWWQGVAVAFLFSLGFFKSYLAQELKTRIQDYIICIEMGVAAVVHLYAFPARPYQRGERCIRNVAVMTDYASLDSPPDPEEVRDSERSTRVWLSCPEDREKQFNFPQRVRDVVVGSGEIMVDDVRFTVSHVVEPVERGIARINETFHQISENVKQHEKRKKKAKDDCYLIPMNSQSREFSEIHDHLPEGSISDSGLARKRPQSTRSS